MAGHYQSFEELIDKQQGLFSLFLKPEQMKILKAVWDARQGEIDLKAAHAEGLKETLEFKQKEIERLVKQVKNLEILTQDYRLQQNELNESKLLLKQTRDQLSNFEQELHKKSDQEEQLNHEIVADYEFSKLRLRRSEEESRNYLNEVKQLREELGKLKDYTKKLKSYSEKLSEHNEDSEELINKLSSELKVLKSEKQGLKKECDKNQAILDSNREEYKNLVERYKQTDYRLKESSTKLKTLNQEYGELKREISLIEGQKRNVEGQAKKYHAQVEEILAKKRSIEEELFKKEKIIINAQDKNNYLVAENKTLRSDKDKLILNLNKAHVNTKKLNEYSAELKSLASNLKASLQKEKILNRKLHAEKHSFQSEIKKMAKEIEVLKLERKKIRSILRGMQTAFGPSENATELQQ